jgi:uncharacterized protein (TIGR03435 family)
MPINPMLIKETRTEEILALGMFGRGSRLRARIEMLLEGGHDFSPIVSRARLAVSVLALLGCMIAGAIAPRLIAFAQRPEFEVATIKPGDPSIHGTMINNPPGRLVMKNITLREAVRTAYRLNEPELIGGPKWVDSEHFDIEGKAASIIPWDQIMQMLQSLLADRFKVKVHREARTLPVYALTIAKNGPKIPRAAVGDPANGATSWGSRNLTAKGVPINILARMLADMLMRPVLDRTGLEGIYNVKLDFAPLEGNSDDTPAPALVTAIQEQLGLKLEATKGPVEVLIIDTAEKPDAN